MQSDLPHTLLAHRDKDEGKKAETTTMNDPAFAMQEAALKRAAARRKAKQGAGQVFTTDELFEQ